MKSLKQQLLDYLREQQGFVNGGELERKALSWGYKGSTASRELRLMREDNLVEKIEEKGPNSRVKSVFYKAIGTPKKTVYKVGGEIVSIKNEWIIK